jgi:hypothetical protein
MSIVSSSWIQEYKFYYTERPDNDSSRQKTISIRFIDLGGGVADGGERHLLRGIICWINLDFPLALLCVTRQWNHQWKAQREVPRQGAILRVKKPASVCEGGRSIFLRHEQKIWFHVC